MKILITKTRNMFRKLSGQTTVRLEGTGWEETAATKEEALSLLQERLRLNYENGHTKRFLAKGNTLFSLYYFDGWKYDIIHIRGNETKYSSCFLNAKTFTEAFKAMYAHWEQYE